MLKTWTLIVVSFLTGSVCLAGPNTPGILPPVPMPAQVVPDAHPKLAPPAVVVEEPGHPGTCCEQNNHPGCLECLTRFFCYRPCSLTPIHELCRPYNPQPPLYLYFLHPPVVDGPGLPYPCCGKHNCWSSSCSAGPHMFALPSGQNAGFDH